MTDLILTTGLPAVTVSASNEARYSRDELLGEARQVLTVDSAESATAAAKTLTEIKAMTRSVVSGHKEAKAPVLDLGRQIDALMKELTSDLDAEVARISRVLGAYQAEQNRKIEEARQKAYEEEQRIRREAAEKERQAEEAARKQREELEAKETRARSAKGAEKARLEQEAAAAKAEKERLERDAANEKAIIAARTAHVATIAPKPAGVATRAEICFEVENITSLYEAAPYLVTLTVNAAALKAALKGLSGDQKLPGVKHWVEQRSIVR